MVRRSRLATAVTFLLLAISASADSFIRVDENASAARLQTAVTRFEKGDESVELIGAIHIADKAYYKMLGTRFEGYDSLLFEMVGGDRIARAADKPAAPVETAVGDSTAAASVPKTAPAAPAAAAAPVAKEKGLAGLRQIYSMVARFLNLSGQVENIDYTAKNFVHADLSLAEFNRLQAERGESLIGFAMKAGKAANEGKQAAEPDTIELLKAMLSGSSNRVKLQIVHTLGQADDQIGALAGESVIISDRNQRCMDVMTRELGAGHKKLGIFYGAAHFPDMEKRLLELGFKRTTQEWLTAWDIPKPAAKPAPAPADLKKAS